MNMFNRFLLILIAITAVLFWGSAVFLVWAFPNDVAGLLRGMGRALQFQPGGFQLVITGIGGSAIAVSMLILIGELFPQDATMLKIGKITGGQAEIERDAIVRALKLTLEQHPEFGAVRPTVARKRSGIEVQIELQAPGGSLTSTAEEAVRIVRSTLESDWGLRITDVRVIFAAAPAARTNARPDPDAEITIPSLRQTTEPPKPDAP